MTNVLTTVILPAENGRASDAVVNNFAHWQPSTASASDIEAARLAYASFYALQAPGASAPISSYLATSVERSSQMCQIKMYDITTKMAGEPHGSPFYTSTFTMTGVPANASLPPQVALCVTLRGSNALASAIERNDGTRPRQRRSGRIFLGPLTAAAGTGNAGEYQRPTTALITDVLAAFEKLQDDLNAVNFSLAIWSRTLQALNEVVRVEIDNSFDVIRSRKALQTARTARVFAPEPNLFADPPVVLAS